jgi:hypothetical protein
MGRAEAKLIIANPMKAMGFALPILLIVRFQNPIENKTSPKSWRRLSLLDRAVGVLMVPINERRHQPNGDR